MTTASSKQGDLSPAMPSNLQAERSVLGAILANNDALLDIRQFLIPEEFFLPQHIHLFGHMLALAEAGTPIDLVTLVNRLEIEQELDLVGGTAYVSSLMNGMPRVSNVAYYAKIVKDTAILRSVIHTTAFVQHQAYTQEQPVTAILADARARIDQLAASTVDQGPAVLAEIVDQHRPALLNQGQSVTGFATGYSKLDESTSGLQNGELIILAARPSVGKSAMALNIAENAVLREAPKTVLLFSLEMSRQSLLVRLVASVGRVDVFKIRTGKLAAEEKQRIGETLDHVRDAPLWIDDQSTITVAKITARAERLKREKKLGLVIVDYLQLLSSVKRFGNRQEEVSYLSGSLKAMAKNLEVPVVALSQLRRGHGKEAKAVPQLADLRESGAIEQDADTVLFIHRPGTFEAKAALDVRQKTELHIAKQRNGPIGKIDFTFLSAYTRFELAATATKDEDQEQA
jgi:replicative DNA helicase